MTSEMFDIKEVTLPQKPDDMSRTESRFVSITAKQDKIETVSKARAVRHELQEAIAALIVAYERATGLPVMDVKFRSIQTLGHGPQSMIEVEVRL